MRLTWHEAVVQKDRLIIRWPTEEKRLRTLVFVGFFLLAAGFVFALVRMTIQPELRDDAAQVGLGFASVAFLLGFCTIWFSRLWVFDKTRNAVLRGGWQQVATIDEFEQFIVKREKRGRDIIFRMLAMRADGTFLELGVMDQDDAHEMGRELARFTLRPYSSR